jgi:hypothetical protein
MMKTQHIFACAAAAALLAACGGGSNPFSAIEEGNEPVAAVIGDFEDAQAMVAAGWTATGAFANPSSAGAWSGTTAAAGVPHVGQRSMSTCEIGGGGCDAPTGTLRSPPFVVPADAPQLNFFMAGGDGTAAVGLRVLDEDGFVVAEYKSNSCAPSYVANDAQRRNVDLTAFAGRKVQVEVFDESSGGCGFVSFDDIILQSVAHGTTLGAPSPIAVPAFTSFLGTFDDAQVTLKSGWTAIGAFANPVSASAWEGATSNPAAVKVGRAVSTCEIGGAGCDAPTGVLTSQAFTVSSTKPYLNFKMSGGNGAANVGLRVKAGNTVLVQYKPNNCANAYLKGTADESVYLDLRNVAGQSVQIELFDEESGACGFVAFDEVQLSATPSGNLGNQTPEQSVGNFDDAQAMIASGWVGTGAFANPGSATAWEGTTTEAGSFKVGRAVGTCTIGGGGCDAPTGTLTSPLFTVDATIPFFSFYMTGGNGSADVGLRVLSEAGTELLRHTPRDCAPSRLTIGEEKQFSWDLSAYIGQRVKVEAFDNESGGCGFVSFDEFNLSKDPKSILLNPSAGSQTVIGAFDDAVAMVNAGWVATGAFANPAAANAWEGVTRNAEPTFKIGSGAVSTCEIGGAGCDAPTGTLTSPGFTVTADKPYLSFLMTGGNGGANVGVKVFDGSTEVASFNPNICGAAQIDGRKDGVHYFDLGAYVGKVLTVTIFDNETGGCGFVSFDNLVLSRQPLGNKRN